MHVVLEAIRELNAPAAYRFADGKVLMAEARLAFVMGDQPAQDKMMGKKIKIMQVVFMPLR
jgi:fructose-specific component phosphotransferase system IIB-like protein